MLDIKVPETPKILTPFLIFEAIKSLSPQTVTEERPSCPVEGVIIYVLLLGVTDFDCKVGELPLDFTCIATHFGVKVLQR